MGVFQPINISLGGFTLGLVPQKIEVWEGDSGYCITRCIMVYNVDEIYIYRVTYIYIDSESGPITV